MPECSIIECRQTALYLHSDKNGITAQADNDTQVIGLWLHGRATQTIRVYGSDVKKFLSQVQNSFNSVTLGQLQQFADELEEVGLQPTTRHRILSVVKSLFSFAHKIGYLKYNVTGALKLPSYKDTLNERILSEAEVQKIIGLEPNLRNQLLTRVLYASGMRVSELCRLCGRDLNERDKGGQVTIFGKNSKTHVVLILDPLWRDLMAYRGNSINGDVPLFQSRKSGGHLHPGHVLRIIRKAAHRAGINSNVSPHWFRHAHASHAIDRGASLALVQSTLNHSSISTTGRYLHVRPEESSSTYLTV